MKKDLAKISLVLVGLFTLTALYLLISFIEGIKGYNAVEKEAEAIVVLTGGQGRAEEGLSLLRKGAAKLLILSGVHEDADIDSIFMFKISPSERGGIILEKGSRSTYENAVEVKKLLEEKNISSIVLITSAYHMKRADYIFRKVLPPSVRIEPYSIVSPNFDEKLWWKGNSFGLVLIEFFKYYWYVVRLSVVL